MAAVDSAVPDLKSQKYDRQLRLWATTGQTALEDAKLCLLNATAMGCEILKNLILPGVGSVTIVDDSTVTEADVASNFFLESRHIGQFKANATCLLLNELNEDVHVTPVVRSVDTVIHQEPSFFDPFSMVIAVDLHDNEALALSDICHQTQKTLILVRLHGLCGVFRVQSPEHAVIETHPENTVDLRLGCPFSELLTYADTFQLDTLDQTDHGHVPFVIVLLKYMEAWKAEHDGKVPQTYSERNQLKENIRRGMRTPDEENFEEAIANVWRLASTETVNSDLRRVFEDPACSNIDATSHSFWIIARAIGDFVANEGQGQLPLSGKLPDMKSDTTNYVGLQQVYHKKAQSDLQAVIRRVTKTLEQLGRPVDCIPIETIQSFCKNAAHVKVLRYGTLREEYREKPMIEKIVSLVKSEENMAYYLVFRAADLFFTDKKYYPGAHGGINDEDVAQLKVHVAAILQSMGLEASQAASVSETDQINKAAINYVRFACRPSASLAALIGGLAAQEAIKLITRQYIPINNTCVFNGISSTSSVYQL